MAEERKKLGRLVGVGVGAAAAAPALFGALGWGAVIVCVGIVVSCTILIVKKLKQK